jgi:type II secretory pathway component PulC
MRQKDLIELGVIGALLAVLIFVFGNAAKKPNSRNIAPKAVDLSGIDQTDKIDRSLYNLLEQQAKSIVLKRDPFTAAPIVSENSTQPGFVLTGIVWDKIKPLAIIDAEVVKKGDRFGNKVVVDIKRDRVILSDGQEFFEIKLEP